MKTHGNAPASGLPWRQWLAATLIGCLAAPAFGEPPVPEGAPSRRPADASKVAPFENSLGMRFVPVAGTPVLFSVWETRVQDFRVFAEDTGFRADDGIWVLRIFPKEGGGYGNRWDLDKGGSWEKPGFAQDQKHPVVGVSWDDARQFCEWLTRRERAAGRIGPRAIYRLPTDAEWSLAVGPSRFPWGEEPPDRLPRGAGNYCDDSCVKTFPGTGWDQVSGDDGFARTAPVGSFTANAFGLHDLGGNAEEWVEDEYRAEMNDEETLKALPALRRVTTADGRRFRALRGASWRNDGPVALRSACRNALLSTRRVDSSGFRVVLGGGGG